MSGQWKYSHPEGVHPELTGHDWVRWPLKRYEECLSSGDRLDYSIREAYRDLRAKHGPGYDTTLGAGDGEEKYALRWHGLQLLREVDNDERME